VLVPVTSASVKQWLPEMRNNSGARSTARTGTWHGLPGPCPSAGGVTSANHPGERPSAAEFQQRGESVRRSAWSPRDKGSERNWNVLRKDAESQ